MASLSYIIVKNIMRKVPEISAEIEAYHFNWEKLMAKTW